MKSLQRRWSQKRGWDPEPLPAVSPGFHLVLCFASTEVLKNKGVVGDVFATFPGAKFLGCSTAGEICGTRVEDDTLVVTAISFQHTQLHLSHIQLAEVADSRFAGEELAQSLPTTLRCPNTGEAQKLSHVLVLSDGLVVNGTELVAGLTSALPAGVTLTGGLAGDGARFAETLVLCCPTPRSGMIAALGFYGDRLRVGYGSLGGWDSFGPERQITRAEGNILYELDGQSALSLYKSYLGKQAAGLPATGLLYPLSLRVHLNDTPVVRTILAVNEQDQSMTFAGDMPVGSYARLMKANFDRLIDGAMGAAKTGGQAIAGSQVELAILISCVGRKLVLKQRIEEEVEGVRDVLGSKATLTGFYSYGEISPFAPGAKCELHNQTMTITTFSES